MFCVCVCVCVCSRVCRNEGRVNGLLVVLCLTGPG